MYLCFKYISDASFTIMQKATKTTSDGNKRQVGDDTQVVVDVAYIRPRVSCFVEGKRSFLLSLTGSLA